MKTVSPYLSAEALGLKEPHRQALIGLASDLANHRIPDDEWQISSWDKCICGHLERRTEDFARHKVIGRPEVLKLFTGYSWGSVAGASITQEQAGKAAYNYLTTGKANWDEVLGV